MTTESSTISGAIQRNKETLVADLKRIVGDADDLLKEIASSTAEELATTRSKIEARLSEAGSRIDAARIAVARKACHAADVTNEYIGENPWKVIGVASLVGLVAAFLLYRRSCE
jgi:ElaB/YqjD/DUF883 family membrane-anchored ribosome-binding protein